MSVMEGGGHKSSIGNANQHVTQNLFSNSSRNVHFNMHLLIHSFEIYGILIVQYWLSGGRLQSNGFQQEKRKGTMTIVTGNSCVAETTLVNVQILVSFLLFPPALIPPALLLQGSGRQIGIFAIGSWQLQQ